MLLGLLVYFAYFTLRPRLGFGWQPPAVWALAVVAALLGVVSLYAHELAHALVARHFGIPVRTISLFLLGGMAHITRESPSPRAEFLIALAGPASSLAIGIVGLLLELAVAVGGAACSRALCFWLGVVNIPLAHLQPGTGLPARRWPRSARHAVVRRRGPALGQHDRHARGADRGARTAVRGHLGAVRRQRRRPAGRAVAGHDRLVHVRAGASSSQKRRRCSRTRCGGSLLPRSWIATSGASRPAPPVQSFAEEHLLERPS